MQFTRRQFVGSGTIAILAPSFAAIGARAAPPKGVPASAEGATFVEAVDGEKLKVKNGDKEHEVRMIGVDAPEKKNGDGFPECYFEESKARLGELLKGRTIYLEQDAEDKDSKDRLWRYVWYKDEIDNVAHMVNEQLLEEGTVIVREEEKNTRYAKQLGTAQSKAKTDNVGMWATCGGGHVAITPVPRHGSADDPGVVGEALTANGMEITLVSAYTDYSYGYSTPKGGYVYLICEAIVRNVDDKSHGYRDGRFSAKDMDTNADFDEGGSATDQAMGSGDLSPSEYIDGVLGIEVQETSHNIRVKYQVNEFGGDSVYWLVSV